MALKQLVEPDDHLRIGLSTDDGSNMCANIAGRADMIAAFRLWTTKRRAVVRGEANARQGPSPLARVRLSANRRNRGFHQRVANPLLL
jgi:hypothetical protein